MSQKDRQQPDAANGQQASDSKQEQVPLSIRQQAAADKLEKQIAEIEQQLQDVSSSELKKIAGKLEAVERAMLLEKIDNELHTMKDTLVKPGDGASTAAAGAAAAGASVINQTPAE